jgi:hypothetical protein
MSKGHLEAERHGESVLDSESVAIDFVNVRFEWYAAHTLRTKIAGHRPGASF